ncbi:histidine phosphatase family protein [Roseibium denhamense]|uniref:Broad specificity phosphatase PhoE n=1 Tax=Roseibium denhamense TaxID=76305 RepID=A0ABY1PP85_9HYPH|nr:histidine phosphatase family protein [Roseibium denhamense]MTI06904.1 histidine phosphatase family protein [Roseibium denhamense]SMP36788.1 Broad specificity phosphatase PhoE [Roseibium denhamense]
MTWCVYLTHPEVVIDPDVPVPDWGLSATGRERAALGAQLPFASDIRRIVSSGEKKAIETAEIFGAAHGLHHFVFNSLHENDRSATGFLPPAEFETVADQFFADPYQSVRSWERAIDAQSRIVTGVRAALKPIREAEPVLFTGHGGVGTLLMCHLMNADITRDHDQKRAGSWFRFEKSWLVDQLGQNLAWTEL